jgi:hypothetical protein
MALFFNTMVEMVVQTLGLVLEKNSEFKFKNVIQKLKFNGNFV